MLSFLFYVGVIGFGIFLSECLSTLTKYAIYRNALSRMSRNYNPRLNPANQPEFDYDDETTIN